MKIPAVDPFFSLGIETSCDETAAAVYHSERGILSNTLFSQIAMHERFGGVIPELASRVHVQKIGPVVQDALDQAQVSLDDIDVIAVTNKPGLPGSLFIGVSFAKALAWSKQKKLIGVNHLEGHIFSAFLEHEVPFPHLCITASGGHTSVYLVTNFGEYTVLGETHDDAAGEAFDKIAKLLGLSYPGGPIIERLAKEAEFTDFFTYPRGKPGTMNFSFSGLKTAVLYDLVKRGFYDLSTKTLLNQSHDLKREVASSLLVCIADIFVAKVMQGLIQNPSVKAVTFVGGVACNKYIMQRLSALCHDRNVQFFKPSAQYCTDNGAMIAFVGSYKAIQQQYDDLTLDILT